MSVTNEQRQYRVFIVSKDQHTVKQLVFDLASKCNQTWFSPDPYKSSYPPTEENPDAIIYDSRLGVEVGIAIKYLAGEIPVIPLVIGPDADTYKGWNNAFAKPLYAPWTNKSLLDALESAIKNAPQSR